MKKNELICIYGKNYKEMTKQILRAANLASDIAAQTAGKKRPVKIGIKPNLVCAIPASFGATTHTEVVEGIIEYLKENGYEDLLIIEGSWVGDQTADAFAYCGYNALSARTGVPLFDTQKDTWHEQTIDGKTYRICDHVSQLDYLINVPVLKGHAQVKVTCALKNLKGLIPNVEKRRFHRDGLHDPIAHLSLGIHQDFIVVDHICGDYDFEEGGNPVVTDCVMCGMDPVLIDAYACQEIGWDITDVPYIGIAEQLGLGTTDLTSAAIYDITQQDRTGERIESADRSAPGRQHHLLDVSYAVDESDSCSACYASLVPALDRLKEEGLLDGLHCKIAIGQGHESQSGILGVGKCCRNYDTCIMGCPPDAEKIYTELKNFILSPSAT